MWSKVHRAPRTPEQIIIDPIVSDEARALESLAANFRRSLAHGSETASTYIEGAQNRLTCSKVFAMLPRRGSSGLNPMPYHLLTLAEVH
jgi:hypothetical protein